MYKCNCYLKLIELWSNRICWAKKNISKSRCVTFLLRFFNLRFLTICHYHLKCSSTLMLWGILMYINARGFTRPICDDCLAFFLCIVVNIGMIVVSSPIAICENCSKFSSMEVGFGGSWKLLKTAPSSGNRFPGWSRAVSVRIWCTMKIHFMKSSLSFGTEKDRFCKIF